MAKNELPWKWILGGAAVVGGFWLWRKRQAEADAAEAPRQLTAAPSLASCRAAAATVNANRDEWFDWRAAPQATATRHPQVAAYNQGCAIMLAGQPTPQRIRAARAAAVRAAENENVYAYADSMGWMYVFNDTPLADDALSIVYGQGT